MRARRGPLLGRDQALKEPSWTKSAHPCSRRDVRRDRLGRSIPPGLSDQRSRPGSTKAAGKPRRRRIRGAGPIAHPASRSILDRDITLDFVADYPTPNTPAEPVKTDGRL